MDRAHIGQNEVLKVWRGIIEILGINPMMITQTLSSGITIRQDFRNSVRAVMFQTGVPYWDPATHGGTIFLVNIGSKVFGLTCRHVFGDFEWRQLAITEAKFGTQIARLKSTFYPSAPTGYATDSDILDIAVIQFADDVDPTFFTDPPYIIDSNTVGTSNEGDTLAVNGNLKDASDLSGPAVSQVFSLLELLDQGARSSDPSLRSAHGIYRNPSFESVTGVSGAPVFNLTQKNLCGMAVRGRLSGEDCRIWYVDMFDIIKILEAIIEGKSEIEYEKTLMRRLRVVPRT